jgi:sugar-specific transcriptional regulator TrmB
METARTTRGSAGRLSAAPQMRHTGEMPSSQVVAALSALGFNLNEGRAYAALLRLGPSTGYEVAQRAGIPRSAVYGALRRLVSGGAARAIAGNPERFAATPADSLVALMKKRFDASAEDLIQAIGQMEVEPAVPDAFSVKGYARVIEEAARLVGGATKLLVASGWPRELAELESELAAAQSRGVYTVLFSHAELPSSLSGVHFSYGLDEASLEDFWKHRLMIVADDRRTLIAATEDASGDTAVLSEASAIAEFAVGQIALDVTLLAQRHQRDVSGVMAKILGDRVGRLDSLLATEPKPVLGTRCGAAPPAGKRRAPARSGPKGKKK